MYATLSSKNFSSDFLQIMRINLDPNTHTLADLCKYLEKEYALLEADSQNLPIHSTNECDKLENNNKNRYDNIKAPDHTLVPISNGKYFHANIINQFIVTQGPMVNTSEDFWQAIWDHNIRIICMVTNLYEKGIEKSYQYWPTVHEQPMTYGFFQIKLITSNQNKCISHCILHIQNSHSNESRELSHILFSGWPDHGAPASAKEFITYIDQVDKINTISDQRSGSNFPICVHCSAGVGRSGTFIAVHKIIHLIRKIVKSQSQDVCININKIILNMRSQRPGMIQSLDQYIFVYIAALCEYNNLQK
jgi:protein tyrosine phosphatase